MFAAVYQGVKGTGYPGESAQATHRQAVERRL